MWRIQTPKYNSSMPGHDDTITNLAELTMNQLKRIVEDARRKDLIPIKVIIN